MTILPKKDKSDNSDSDGSNSSNNSTKARRSPKPRDAYQHTASGLNEDYDSSSQSTACSVSRSKRRLRASVATRPIQTPRPPPLSLALPILPPPSACSSAPQSSGPSLMKPRKIPALIAAGYSSDECNSAEEYDDASRGKTDSEREQRFEEYLWKEWGYIIKQMKLDGNCLFRSIADQIYGDEEMQSLVRSMCMDYMLKNNDYFAEFVTEDFSKYISRKRRDCCYGNHLEMQALSEMYNRNIEVYQFKKPPIVFYSPDATDNDPMRLSYHGQIHYNSIVDPKRPAVGVGLGLPGYKPSEEDKRVLERAIKESEEFTIEQSMLKDKLDATEIEATNEAVEEAIARESYLIWLEENRKRHECKETSSSIITQSLSSPSHDMSPSNSPPRSPLLRSQSLTSLNPLLKPASHSPPPQAPSPSQLPTHSLSYPSKVSPVAFKRQASSPSLAILRSSPCPPLTSPSHSDSCISFSRPKQTHKHGHKKLSSSVSNLRPVPYPSPKTSPHASKHTSPSSSPRSSPLLSHPLPLSPEHVAEKSPCPPAPSSSSSFDPIYPFEYSSMLDAPSFGLSDWGDDSIIAAVMAASQQEYFQAQLNIS